MTGASGAAARVPVNVPPMDTQPCRCRLTCETPARRRVLASLRAAGGCLLLEVLSKLKSVAVRSSCRFLDEVDPADQREVGQVQGHV